MPVQGRDADAGALYNHFPSKDDLLHAGVNEIKLVATAMANVAIRLSDAAGPYLVRTSTAWRVFHARLALRMVARRQ